jgi:putative endonuclease
MNDRLARYQKGHRAERMARYFLNCKFYRLLELRYKTKLGEIDLVMAKGNKIIFCEVKARNELADGFDAVSPHSQQRIQRAATYFVQRNPAYQNYDWRFDVVVVRPWRLPYHLKDAWRP